jgi:hypothetical protein
MTNQEKQSKEKKIKKGPLGQRLDELNEEAAITGLTETLYPQEKRFKKPATKEAMKGPTKEEFLNVVKRAIEEVFGKGAVNWADVLKKKKKKTEKEEENE